jgi:hypothetical protein
LNTKTVKWLKQPNVTANLTGNPWNCECSALGEAWWELGNKMTLNCASPEERKGSTWKVIEALCPDNIPDTNSVTADYGQGGTSSLMTIILIVTGVLSGCVLIAGGIILVVLVKRLRDRSNDVQNGNVYTPGTSYLPVATESLTDMSSNNEGGKENVYETIT